MSDFEQLKPCPFCGQAPEVLMMGNEDYYECHNLSCGNCANPIATKKLWNTRADIASMQGEAVAYLVRSLANKHVTGDPLEGEVFVDGYWGALGSWRPCLPDKLHEEEFSYFYGPDKPRRRPGFEKKPLFTYPPSASAEIARLQKELEEARKDAERYRWLRDGNAYDPEENFVTGGVELDDLCDAAISKIGGAE